MTHPSVNSIVERAAIPSNDADLLMLCTAHPSEAATIISELQAERDALSADLEKVQTELDEENIRALIAESSISRIKAETIEACAQVCDEWIGTFQDVEIKYTSAREYAIDAIEDVADRIRSLGSTGGAEKTAESGNPAPTREPS